MKLFLGLITPLVAYVIITLLHTIIPVNRIKGYVKNNGLKNVTQCLIKVNIYDKNNNIVNTDKLYIFGDIGPGKTNTFHLITSWPKSAKIYNLTIEEVRIKE